MGSIESWLQDTGYKISRTRFFNSDVLPEVEDIDFLIVMGGPMSATDETEYPWLANEKKYIGSVIEAGKPVLGICLGAQLIANSMGGKVFQNSVIEIGWFPIEAVASEMTSAFRFPQKIQVIHWHGETFRPPKGAIQIAGSKGCENQAFQFGSKAIGLQFHLENTPLSARAIVENCRNQLVEGKYIQSEADILSAPQEHYSSINSLMGRVLEYLQANNG